MSTYFADIRITRSDEHYWGVGLAIEALTIQDAVNQISAFEAGIDIGSAGAVKMTFMGITTHKSRGQVHHKLTNPKELREELRDFLASNDL